MLKMYKPVVGNKLYLISNSSTIKQATASTRNSVMAHRSVWYKPEVV